MIKQPRWKPFLSVHVLEPDLTYLVCEERHWRLNGSLFAAVAPLLDGSRDETQIDRALAGHGSAFDIAYAMRLLEQAGLIEESLESARVMGENPVIGPDGVQVVWTQEIDALCIKEILVKNNDQQPDAAIVLADDPLESELPKWDRHFRTLEIPWLLVIPTLPRFQIGPFFGNNQSCFSCFKERLTRIRKVGEYLNRFYPNCNGNKDISIDHAVLVEAFSHLKKWKVGETTLVAHQVLVRERENESWVAHRVMAGTRCRLCRSSLDRTDFSQPDEVLTDEETTTAMNLQISPVSGLIPEVRFPETEASDIFHLAVTDFHPFMNIENRDEMDQALANPAMGKGVDKKAARASAIGETIERYCSMFNESFETNTARYCDLGDEAIHPNSVMGFSEAQYASRSRKDAGVDFFDFVPEPFDEDAEVAWTPCWSFSQKRQRLLPAGLVTMGFPSESDSRYFIADSNGCATGMGQEDALTRAFLELAERDAVGIWWYNRIRLPEVVLVPGEDPWRDRFLARLNQLGRHTWVLELTNDLQIPVYVAVSSKQGRNSDQIALGFGADFDPVTAIRSALLEMGQLLFGLNHDPSAAHVKVYPGLSKWFASARLRDHDYLKPHERKPCSFESEDGVWSGWQQCLDRAHRLSLEVLAINLTDPAIGLPVARVIVPGLRHFWRRLGPGRLYTVPVTQGWRDVPPVESEMNPVPFFL